MLPLSKETKDSRSSDFFEMNLLAPSSTYEFASILRVLWNLASNWILKGYLSATKATATGYVEANIYEALDPITVGQKNTMNLKRGPANCTTETFTRVQREHENPLFLVRLRRVQRERTRGLNEASIIIGHARSDEEREPLLSCPFDCDHGTITGW